MADALRDLEGEGGGGGDGFGSPAAGADMSRLDDPAEGLPVDFAGVEPLFDDDAHPDSDDDDMVRRADVLWFRRMVLYLR